MLRPFPSKAEPMMTDYLASDLLVDQLAVEGTRFIFGKPGATALPLMETMVERADVGYVVALHEGIAVSMAMGYAQASGKTGVVDVSTPAGLLSALSAVLNARESRIPLVILSGQQSTAVLNEQDVVERDLCSLAAPFCKWIAQLNVPDELTRMVRRAFHQAMSPPAGPAFLSLPVNLMRQPVTSRVIMPPRLSPLAAADSAFLKRTAQLLVAATRPAVVLGNEVWQYRARNAAVSLVEVLGCPAFVESAPTGVNFPNQHPLFAGVLPADEDGQHATIFSGYDVILALGVQNRAPFLSGASTIPSTTVVVQINMDPLLAGCALPCHFCASADLAESLSRLRAEVQLVVDNPWVVRAKERFRETASVLETARKADTEALLAPGSDGSIQVARCLRMLDEVRPRKSVIVNDFGTFSPLPMRLMTMEHSSAYLATNGHAPGYALPAALGVKWASPDYAVICITGDGSLLHYPQSLWTAGHYNLSVKVVVLNNQGYGPAQAHGEPKSGFRGLELRDPPVSFLELAGSMGMPANTISSANELQPALKEMIETDGPYLLDVRIKT